MLPTARRHSPGPQSSGSARRDAAAAATAAYLRRPYTSASTYLCVCVCVCVSASTCPPPRRACACMHTQRRRDVPARPCTVQYYVRTRGRTLAGINCTSITHRSRSSQNLDCGHLSSSARRRQSQSAAAVSRHARHRMPRQRPPSSSLLLFFHLSAEVPCGVTQTPTHKCPPSSPAPSCHVQGEPTSSGGPTSSRESQWALWVTSEDGCIAAAPPLHCSARAGRNPCRSRSWFSQPRLPKHLALVCVQFSTARTRPPLARSRERTTKSMQIGPKKPACACLATSPDPLPSLFVYPQSLWLPMFFFLDAQDLPARSAIQSRYRLVPFGCLVLLFSAGPGSRLNPV